jgi:hypothetical protein
LLVGQEGNGRATSHESTKGRLAPEMAIGILKLLFNICKNTFRKREVSFWRTLLRLLVD